MNGAPFFITLSRKIDFLGISNLPGRKIQNIFQAYKSLHRYYLRHVFRITTVHADGEFFPLKELIEVMPGDPSMNLTGANEHVPGIERGIRVVKERIRALRHSLPYNMISLIMTIWGILVIARMLNQEQDLKDIYSQDHSKRRKLGLKKSPTYTIWTILSGT